jgi:DNA repair protein RadD
MSALQLREAQMQGVEMLRQGFAAGHRCQMLYLPTGGGKTEIAISMMALAADKGNRSAMILDRRNLVNQTSQRLDRYKIQHGVMMAGSGRMLIRDGKQSPPLN